MFDFFRMIWHQSSSDAAGNSTTQTPPIQIAPSPGTTDAKMHGDNPMPPPTTPAKRNHAQPPPRDAKMQDSPSRNPPPPQPSNTNPPRILTTPKRKRDYISEVIHEVDGPSNPLPAGYIGTFRGTRFFAPDYNISLGCTNNLHRLSCGHWVSSLSPCGVNCSSPCFDNAPFACPTCRDVVQNILSNQPSAEETARLHALKARDAFLFVGCAVELVTRRAHSLEGNVTEAVLCALKPGYGRGCETAAGPLPARVPTIEQIVTEMQDAEEKKERGYSNKRQKRRKGSGTFMVPSVAGVKREAKFGEPLAKKRRVG